MTVERSIEIVWTPQFVVQPGQLQGELAVLEFPTGPFQQGQGFFLPTDVLE